MVSAKVTSKGQVAIPAAVRAALGLDAGSRVEFVEIGNRQFAIVPANEEVQGLKGMLRRPAVPVSIEEMNIAIATRGRTAK
ncbi:MAG: AbrB/MazE/SpoVT family DNA-binding domain-containing protein [Noviherbaspirillum sp.]